MATERAFTCPKCSGPLAPPRFARTISCPYCGATVTIDPSSVSVARFRQAYASWNAPATHGFGQWLALGESRWAPGEHIAQGEISDVYRAVRARLPTERAILKVLRDERDRALFDHEWDVLQSLHERAGDGTAAMLARLPAPIAHGVVSDGTFAGRRVTVLGWAPGFRHTLADVRRAFAAGIDPQSSIWVWRRVLEVLAFLHKQGCVHGAVLPPHLLVEDGEHGVRVVGLSATDTIGASLRVVHQRWKEFYPASRTAAPGLDVIMSARCLSFALGGDADGGRLPAAVPGPLAALVRDTAKSGEDDAPGAWSLREQLGTLATEVFGPPKFCPIALPA